MTNNGRSQNFEPQEEGGLGVYIMEADDGERLDRQYVDVGEEEGKGNKNEKWETPKQQGYKYLKSARPKSS